MSAMSSVQFEDASQPRLASNFGGRQLITRKVAAAILGVDVKTLTAMREQRTIASVRTATGEYRFSETDLRAYLKNTESITARDA